MTITQPEALEYFRSDDLIGVGMEADALRSKLHPERVVTYNIDRSIHYTNFCTESCSFCAFYRPVTGARSSEPYIADFETIYQKIAETVELGGSGVLIQGGLHSDLKVEWFERMLRGIKVRFPEIWLHCFSAPEILAIAKCSGLTVRETIVRLRDAGWDSIPGDGAEILDDEVRYPAAQRACSSADWVSVHRIAHELGMRTTATMMFGIGETLEQRVNHLEVIRRLQEDTGGFASFIPWGFQARTTTLAKWDEPTAVEYLKVLAVSRLYLDNIENVQSNWAAQGLKVLQLGLRFGGNDAGSVMLEESLVPAAGTERAASEEDLRRVIRDAGFRPVQRDTIYTTFFLD